jgi:hypothetical protein
VVGTLFTVWQLRGCAREADRSVLLQAAKWQGFGASVVLMHALLQLMVEAVRWMHALGPGLGQPLDRLIPPVLAAATWLNVGSGLAEYAFVVFWGLRAARGADLPFFRGGDPLR